MKTTLDNVILFDEQTLQISSGSFHRDSIERTVPGLDGTLSIDLGQHGRKIKQTGTLRAKSRANLEERIGKIATFIDGNTHTLVTNSGQEISNLRMDSFKQGTEHTDGTGIVTDYEIIYTQLV
jgi:hypothetical protein